MARTASRPARLLCAGTKYAAVAVVSFLAVVPVLPRTSHADHQPNGAVSQALLAEQATLDRLMSEHHCSPGGFGPDVVPGSALVERDDVVRQVSFADGWEVFTGRAAGTLLAVCRLAA